MSGRGIRALLRSDLARLVFVAVLGAGMVIAFQALTSGSTPNRPGPNAAATSGGAASSRPGAPVTTAGGRTTRAGAASAKPGTAAAGGAGATAPPDVASPVTPRTLGRLPVAGSGLALVIDEPSGPLAQQNRLIMQGAKVAVGQLNAAGGVAHRGVRLVGEQLDRLSPAAVQARLHAAGAGAVLILPCDTNSQTSLAAGAAPYRTLMLAPCNSNPALAQRIATYWPVGMAGNDEAAGLAGFMRAVGYSTVFVVGTPGLSYAASLTRYFSAAVRAKNIQVSGTATVSLATGDAEIKRLASAIVAARPRPAGVFSALPPPYINQLAAGLARAGVHQTLIGTSAMDTPLTLSSRGSSALENATFSTYGFASQTPRVAAFVNAYRKRFGLPVGAFPGLGFETIGLLEDAIAKARSTDPAAIGQALLGGIDHVGVALADRSYRSATDHNPISTVSVEKISARSFLPLRTSSPTQSPKA